MANMIDQRKYILSLDVGTTNIRATVIDSMANECGRSISQLKLLFPKPGWVEFCPEALWQTCLYVMNEAMKIASVTASDLTTVGLSTQRNSFVTWNKETGEMLHNFISWQDLRSAKDCMDLNSSSLISIIRYGSKLGSLSGSNKLKAASKFQFTTPQVILRLKWVLNNIPQVKSLLADKKVAFGTVDTFLLHKMTGGKVYATDYTNVSSTGLYDPFSMSWNNILMILLKIPKHIFPEIKDTADDYGEILDGFLGAAVPINCVVADQQSALFGQCCFNRGDTKITMGTGTFVNVNTGDKPFGSSTGMYPLVAWKIGKELVFMSEGQASSTGTALEWAKKFTFFDEFEDMDELATVVPSTNGVYFIPALSGLQHPYLDPYARAGLLGLTYDTNKSHVVRAILQSLAFRIKEILDMIESDFNIKIIKCDGGVTNSDFTMQLICDLTQRDVERPQVTEVTSLGAAFLAGLYSKIWKNKEELIKLRKGGKCWKMKPCSDMIRMEFMKWRNAVKRCLKFDPPLSEYAVDAY